MTHRKHSIRLKKLMKRHLFTKQIAIRYSYIRRNQFELLKRIIKEEQKLLELREATEKILPDPFL